MQIMYNGEPWLVLQYDLQNNLAGDDFVVLAPARYFDTSS